MHSADTNPVRPPLTPSEPPPDSEIPPVTPEPHLEDVTRPAEAQPGGLDNIPEELLSESDRMQDRLDHLGMDVELPGEAEAREFPTEPIKRHTGHAK